jgi:hypothetical protein
MTSGTAYAAVSIGVHTAAMPPLAHRRRRRAARPVPWASPANCRTGRPAWFTCGRAGTIPPRGASSSAIASPAGPPARNRSTATPTPRITRLTGRTRAGGVPGVWRLACSLPLERRRRLLPPPTPHPPALMPPPCRRRTRLRMAKPS